MHLKTERNKTPFLKANNSVMGGNARLCVIVLPAGKPALFPKALDALYTGSYAFFHVIVVEGNAPDGVRLALEARKKKRQGLKIIYTNHDPGASEAINLCAVHIRTPYVFIMNNDFAISAERISEIVREEEVCERGGPDRRLGKAAGFNGAGAFLVSREELLEIGEWPEGIRSLDALKEKWLNQAHPANSIRWVGYPESASGADSKRRLAGFSEDLHSQLKSANIKVLGFMKTMSEI